MVTVNILMLAPEEFLDYTGTPLSVYSRARALAELGHKVDLVVYHVGKDVQLAGVRVIRIPSLPFVRRVKVGPSLAKFPLDFLVMTTAFGLLTKKKYDYIHAHEEASVIASILGLAFGVPFLYDMHSSLSEQMSNYGVSFVRLFASLVRAVEVWTVRRAAGVIVVYDRLAELVKAIAPRTRTTVIHNTIFHEGYNPFVAQREDVEAVKHLQLSGHRIVAHFGTLETNQGLNLLLGAAPTVAKVYPDVKFLVVGGKADQISEYRSKVSRLGMTQHFVFTGQVSPSVAWQMMLASDVLLSLRDRGTNPPLKIYTYLVAGRPIVATDLPVHTDVLGQREAVLVPPTSDGVGEGIVRVLRDDAYANELAACAASLARDKYGYDNFLCLTRQAVAQFVRRRRPALLDSL